MDTVKYKGVRLIFLVKKAAAGIASTAPTRRYGTR